MPKISKSGWTATYKSDDSGTERLLTVRDAEGNIIGQKDPFHFTGIPVSKKRRDKIIKEAIKDIILEYQQKQFEKPSTVLPEVLTEVKEKARQLPEERVIDRAAGGEPGWTATYSETKRLVTVRDAEGNIIRQRDPFYPVGVPASKRQQEDRIRKVIRGIVSEYQRKQFEKLPTNPRKSKFLERETVRTSRAKTIRGFISDVVRAFDDVIEKGWGEQELTAIHHPKYDRTVEERLLAGEDVAFNSKTYGYDLRPDEGFIYVYYRELPPGEEDLFPLIY